MKRTKIVATIGPASESPEVLTQMVSAGQNVARLNFSHNTHEHHLKLIKNIRAAADEVGQPIAIIADLQGPRIRIGEVADKGVAVKKGQTVVLFYVSDSRTGRAVKKIAKKSADIVKKLLLRLPIHYRDLYKDVKKHHLILIDDALVKLQVDSIKNREIWASALADGVIKTHKGMNFPESLIKADPLTEKDQQDLAFAVENKVDFVALSFVKSDQDIIRLRKKILALENKNRSLALWPKTPRTQIIAKIERREAIKNLEKIIKVADAVMVARGDLGIELPLENVPLLQKKIVTRCNWAGKPVIVATQMMESMTENPRPTRAEVSDVANAILDGTDAIMLSGESATGRYPKETVQAMKDIADEIEPMEFKIQQELEIKLKKTKTTEELAAFTAQDLAEKTKAKAIVCLTRSGYLARLIVRYKSKVPVYAFTSSEIVRNQLCLSWGVLAWAAGERNKKDWLQAALAILREEKKIKAGDNIVVASGNCVRLEEV